MKFPEIVAGTVLAFLLAPGLPGPFRFSFAPPRGIPWIFVRGGTENSPSPGRAVLSGLSNRKRFMSAFPSLSGDRPGIDLRGGNAWNLGSPSGDGPDLPEDAGPIKKTGRAVLEFLTIMAYSQVSYWIRYSDWFFDWHYRFTWEDQKKRFFSFEAWKFDANAFSLNWSHAPAGALYYNCARANNLSLGESLLFTAAASLYWEYFVEWREVISINDMIMTTLGGLPFGESFHQFTFDLSRRRGLVYRILSFINPFLTITRFLDRDAIRRRPPPPAPGWHEYDFFFGGQSLHHSGPIGAQRNAVLGVHTRIIEVPEYGKPGSFRKRVPGTLSSDLNIDFAFRGRYLEEMNFTSRVGYWGVFRQDLDEEGRGSSVSFSLGTAFTYWRKRRAAYYDSSLIAPREGGDLHLEEPRNFRDKLAALHMIGPLLDYTVFRPDLKLRFTAGLYADFALVNSLAFNRYSVDHDITGVKTNLLYYGYYYALGASASGRLEAWWRNIYASGRCLYQTYKSLDVADRFEYFVTEDFSLRDSRLTYDLRLGYQWPGTPLELRISFEGCVRRGDLKDIFAREREDRWSLGLHVKI